MTKYFSILLSIGFVSNGLIASSNRATMCSPDLYGRGTIYNMQSTQDLMPSTPSNLPYPPAFNPAAGHWNLKQDTSVSTTVSTTERIGQATGVLTVIGGIIGLGKWTWDHIGFGQQVVNVGQQAVDIAKKEQYLKEKDLQQSAIALQAQNEANDLNREINEDAYRAQAALNSLTREQLVELAMDEMRNELKGTPTGTHFRTRLNEFDKRQALLHNNSNNNTLPN
jgi:hypothetical protein